MHSASRRAARREGGAVAVEMALVTPLFLLLVLGTATLGHAIMVRSILAGAASDAARTCALARAPNAAACADLAVRRKIDTTANWCQPLTIVTTDVPDPQFPAVSSLNVAIRCGYRAAMGSTYLAEKGVALTNLNLQVRAAMPH